MCEYCGCRRVPAIGELMEEHDVILGDAHDDRAALSTGDRGATVAKVPSRGPIRTIEGEMPGRPRPLRRTASPL